MYGPGGWSEYGRWSYALQYGVRGKATPRRRSPLARELMRPGQARTSVPGR